MTRSIWKGPLLNPYFFRKQRLSKKNLFLNIFLRSAIILPQFVGQKIGVHNGKKFLPIVIKEDMVGHKFGEFVFTKKKPIHKKKTKK